MTRLLAAHTALTPADHATHRRYPFDVPAHCVGLEIAVSYAPKAVALDDSRRLAEAALVGQTARLTAQLDDASLAAAWSADYASLAHAARISNLLTISLDDASGVYRGAGHRHAHYQQLVLRSDTASPGLVAGPLPPGRWTLTLSVHTLVSAQCGVDIQIGAEMATSRSSAS